MKIKKYTRLFTRLIIDKEFRFRIASKYGIFDKLEDEEFLKRKFKACLGYDLNLDNPRTYNEKLQWLKLYNRDPQYVQMVDKESVKQFVTQKIGEKYVIPTLGVWNDFEEIDFDTLPAQFVLKCTHDSGGLAIVKDKSSMNKTAIRKKINKSLKKNYFYVGREWPYKNVPKRIIAEKYMVDSSFEKGKSDQLKDYKFYCFDGEVKFVMINSERFSNDNTKATYFDRNYKKIEMEWGYKNANNLPEKPFCFDKMCELAEILSEGIPHVRVDLYLSDGEIYFGELTFFDGSGFEKIEPFEMDYALGEYITLPDKIL